MEKDDDADLALNILRACSITKKKSTDVSEKQREKEHCAIMECKARPYSFVELALTLGLGAAAMFGGGRSNSYSSSGESEVARVRF